MGWFHQFGYRGFLSSTVITLQAVFFFGFLAAGLVAAIDLGFCFLGPAVFLVAATLDCVVAYVTGSGEGLGFGGGVTMAFTTGPLGRSDSSSRPSLFTRQKVCTAEILERRDEP